MDVDQEVVLGWIELLVEFDTSVMNNVKDALYTIVDMDLEDLVLGITNLRNWNDGMVNGKYKDGKTIWHAIKSRAMAEKLSKRITSEDYKLDIRDRFGKLPVDYWITWQTPVDTVE